MPNVDIKKYEDFVSNSPYGSFTQSSLWAKAKVDWDSELVAVYDKDGNIKAAMQILFKKLPVIKSTFAYSTRGPVCDCTDKETLTELMEEAKKVAKKHHAYMLKVDPMIPHYEQVTEEENFSFDKEKSLEVVENFKSLGFEYDPDISEDITVQSLKNYLLNISGKTKEEVFEGFHSKWRYNIRVAERKGVTCKAYGKEKLDDFCMLMKETGERDGFHIRSKEYFANMMDALGEHARLYMCYAPDGEPISGALDINYAKRVSYLYGASGNGHRNLMPNHLMQWTMIQWAVETGCDLYDFMGVPHYNDETHSNYGVYKFKKGFNGYAEKYLGEFNYIPSKAKYQFLKWAAKTFMHRDI